MSISEEQYKITISMAYRYAQLIAGMDLSGAITACNLAETLGPILDPTLYKENGPKMSEDLAILYALLECKNHLPQEFLAQCREKS